MVTVQRRIIFPSCVKLLKEINCHGTIVGIYVNSAFLSLSQYSLSIFGHHLLFLHRIGTEGSKGTSSVCPAWCGHRKFCRLPALIFSFPLLTLLFPPSPTLEPLLCSLYVCSFCCRCCLIWFTIYFYIAHMNETLKDLSFSILLISLSLIPSRSICIVTNGEFPLFYG